MPHTVLGVDLERMVPGSNRGQLFNHLSDDTFSYRHVRESSALAQIVQTEIVATMTADEMVYELRSAVVDQEIHPVTIFFVVERNQITDGELIGEKMRMAQNIRGADYIAAFRAATPFEQFRLLGYH